MGITKEEIRHLARLCRLGLTENEEENFQKGLSSILDYVARLKEADVSDADLDFQAAGLENIFRPDEVAEEGREEMKEIMTDNYPQKEGEYLKVRAVFDQSADG